MKPNLNTYGGDLRELGYAGQVADSNDVTSVSKINNGATAIDFGVAVARDAGDDLCKAVTADTDTIIGLSMRHAIRPASAAGDVLYVQNDDVPVMKDGFMFATAFENATRGDYAVAVVAQAGKLGSNTTSLGATVAAKVGNTGNGVLTLDGVAPVSKVAKKGIYVASCIAVVANGGTFRVSDPDGYVLGDVAVGATFDNDIKFSIADGATDFVAGDAFNITVGAGRVVLDGSGEKPKVIWETTTAAGALGKVRVS
jgi:hypothetical protein